MSKRAIVMGSVVISAALAACSTPPVAPVFSGHQAPVAKQIDKNGAYIVQPGDTIYSVAWRFGLDYRDIAELNHLQKPYKLQVGQHLKMVEPGKTAAKYAEGPVVVNRHLAEPTPPASTVQAAAPTPKAHAKPKAVTSNTLQWQWPTHGKVVKPYSATSTVPNKGIDISGKSGQPIVAAAAGEVVYSGNGIPGYGNLIIIKHDATYLTAYARNEKNLVHEGTKVKGGQKIARMGQLDAKRAGLHFEIRQSGKPVNPLGKSYLTVP